MKQVNSKPPVVFYVGIVTLFLVLVSSCFTGGLYARYTATSSGGDEARVATFNVTIDPDVSLYTEMIDLGEMKPGDTKPLTFNVKNAGEVSIAFKVYATNLTGNLPIDVPLSGTPEAATPIFSQSLQPDGTATFTVSVSWDKENSDPSAAGKTDLLELRVVAEQID